MCAITTVNAWPSIKPNTNFVANNTPQNQNGVVLGTWLNFQDALNLNGVAKPPPGQNQQVVIIALQGNWNGQKPTANAMGQVPVTSINFPQNFNQAGYGQFNYAIYLPSAQLWLDANHGKPGPNATFTTPQQWYLRPQLPTTTNLELATQSGGGFKPLNATIYIAIIIKNK